MSVTRKQAYRVFCDHPEFRAFHRKLHMARKIAKEYAMKNAETNVYIEHRTGKMIGRYTAADEPHYAHSCEGTYFDGGCDGTQCEFQRKMERRNAEDFVNDK